MQPSRKLLLAALVLAPLAAYAQSTPTAPATPAPAAPAPGAPASSAPTNAQGAKPALYTDAQAQAGATVYSQACAACHGQQLEGVAAPALKGSAFGDMATAQGLTAASLLDVIANTMPQSDPGSMKPDDYNAVTAYILQQNGYPSGSAPLAKDATGMDTKVTP